jgi:hypothetical protein
MMKDRSRRLRYVNERRAAAARSLTALLGIGLMSLLLAACSSEPREGSGSPFQSGSIAGSVEGSANFTVAQVIRDSSGAIAAAVTYTGSCNLVKAQLRFSYTKGGQTVTGKSIDGIDTHFDLGPLAPNEPYQNSYLGEDKFTPYAIVFVISNERCA